MAEPSPAPLLPAAASARAPAPALLAPSTAQAAVAPNYQDLSDSQSSDDHDDDEQDWEAIVAAGTAPVPGRNEGAGFADALRIRFGASAAEAAFTEAEIAEMQHALKERGLFAFLTEYLDHKQVPPHTLLLAFGVRVASLTPLLFAARLFGRLRASD